MHMNIRRGWTMNAMAFRCVVHRHGPWRPYLLALPATAIDDVRSAAIDRHHNIDAALNRHRVQPTRTHVPLQVYCLCVAVIP